MPPARASSTRRCSAAAATTRPTTSRSTHSATPTSPAARASINFPVTAAAFQRVHRGCDTTWFVMCAKTAFVTKVNPWGTGLVYSTYLGGSGVDQESYAEGIAIDGAGNAYVTGATTADNFPTTAGVIQPKAGYPLCYYKACTDAFVTKLNAAGSALVYSTYLMGDSQDFANGIAVDSCR